MTHYTNTDQRLHVLCQIITKANRTFLPKREDDSHTNLYFDLVGNRITGRWIETDVKKLLFTLNLLNLNIDIIDSSQNILSTYTTVGSTIKDIENEIEKGLIQFGLNNKGFTKKLHYDIPEYSFTDEHVALIPRDDIKEWKRFRQLANEACILFLGYTQTQEEIRIWPHHFDTGIYVVVNEKVGLALGIAMEDEMVGEPYFYFAGYPTEGELTYKALPKKAGWNWIVTENWKGAVLPLSKLSEKTDAERKNLLQDFLVEASGWYLAQ